MQILPWVFQTGVVFLVALGSLLYLAVNPHGTVCRVCSFDVTGSGLELLVSGARRSLLCVYPPSPLDLPALAFSFWCLPALHS